MHGDHTSLVDRSKGHVSVNWNKHLAAKAHYKDVMRVKFSPNGRYLLTCGNDRAIRLWDAHSGVLLPVQYRSPPAHSMAFMVDIINPSGLPGKDLLIYPQDDTGRKWYNRIRINYCLCFFLLSDTQWCLLPALNSYVYGVSVALLCVCV
jgi:WD40 repeat protein